ncbi:MAG: biotin/lipoyl-containing protein [Opitutaceae bacterium]
MIRKLRITVAGKAYDVMVEALDDEGHPASSGSGAGARIASAPVSAPVSTPPARPAVSAAAGAVVSPLAGKVVSISVKAGDVVKEGDTVVVLEAMKMNTLVTALGAGRVSEILVKPGDAVEEGQALVNIS